jgi:predicted 2-oxoglutarate/Fe(II)-dependent dioxygenase YbiX
MLISPHDERLRPLILKALEKIKAVSGVEELYIAEYLINIYFPGFAMGVHTDTEDGKGHFAVSAVTYFNSDYEGGEIVFPKLPLTHKPSEGDLAIFPSSDDRFDHGVNVITSGVRYVMPIWTTQDKNQADTFIHQEQ